MIDIETTENVFEAKALEVVKKQFGLFGFNFVLDPTKEKAAIKVVAAALREAVEAEREACAKIYENGESSGYADWQFAFYENFGLSVDGPTEAMEEIKLLLKKTVEAEREACAKIAKEDLIRAAALLNESCEEASTAPESSEATQLPKT